MPCHPPPSPQLQRFPSRLYTYVNEGLFSKPTYASFIKLLDNYHRQTGTGEKMTAQQQAEQDTFLQEAMNTALMKELYGFLHQKGECGMGWAHPCAAGWPAVHVPGMAAWHVPIVASAGTLHQPSVVPSVAHGHG